MPDYSRLFQLDPDIQESFKRKKGLYPAADMQDLFAGSSQHATVMQAAAEESARAQQAFAGATKRGVDKLQEEKDKAKAAASGSSGGAPPGVPQPPLIPPGTIPDPHEKPEQPPPAAPIPDVVPPTTKPPGQPTERPTSTPIQVDDWMNNRSSAQPGSEPNDRGFIMDPAKVGAWPEGANYDPGFSKSSQDLGLPEVNDPGFNMERSRIWKRPQFQGSFRNADFGGFREEGGPVYGGRRGRKYRIGENGKEETLYLPPGSKGVVIPDDMPEVQGQNFQSPEIRKIAERPDDPRDPGGYDDGWEHPSHPNPMQGLIARRDRNLDLASMGPDVYQPPGSSENIEHNQKQLITPASGDMEKIRQDLGSPGVPGMGPTRERVVPGEEVSANFVGQRMDPVDRAELRLRGRIQEGPIKTGLWSRLGKGFMWGVDNWKAEGGQGGLGGALGAGLAGLTTYGVSPKTQAAIDYKRDVGKLMGDYKTALQPQLLDIELQTMKAEMAGKQANARTAQINTILTAYKPAIEFMLKNNKSVPEIIQELNKLGVRATEFDVRELIEGHDALGLPQARYKTGDPGKPPTWFPNPSRGADPTKTAIPIKVDGKTVGYQPSPQAATTAVGAAGRADAIEVRKQTLKQQQENQTRIQGNSDRDFDLRKKQFMLNQQREQRLHAAAQEAIRTKKANDPVAKALEKRRADLDNARQAVESIRAEADRVFANPTYKPGASEYNADTEEQREKDLADIAKRERKALGLYEAILKRIERGQ